MHDHIKLLLNYRKTKLEKLYEPVNTWNGDAINSNVVVLFGKLPFIKYNLTEMIPAVYLVIEQFLNVDLHFLGHFVPEQTQH